MSETEKLNLDGFVFRVPPDPFKLTDEEWEVAMAAANRGETIVEIPGKGFYLVSRTFVLQAVECPG